MPVSVPGFSSYQDFFDLFLPLKSERNDKFFYQQPVTLDESWFHTLEKAETQIPFTEDCLRALKLLIVQYADCAQKKYILQTLLHNFPNLPVNFINAAHSLYMAIVRREHVDLAILNTLGLASCHLLAEGNGVSRLALFIRQTVIDWAGDSFIKQFLGIDENSAGSQLFTALAVMAIALKYWLSDPKSPQRRLLQIPPYLANIVLRAGQYWDQLGLMSQHATEQCLLPAKTAGQDYLCVRDAVDLSRAEETVLARDAWTCAVGQGSRWKPLETCDFALSAAALKQVREEGVVGTRRRFDAERSGFFRPEEDEPLPVSSASPQGSYTSLLALPAVLPVISRPGWKGAGLAALGTSAVALVGYARYALSSNPPITDSIQKQADALFGILAESERELLGRMALRHPDLPPENPPPGSPFSQQEILELEDMLNNLSDENQPSSALREKRAADNPPGKISGKPAGKAVLRKKHWAQREQQAAADSPEKPLLAMLKKGPQPSGKYSLAVPRESFPLADGWYTRMDQLKLDEYSADFQKKLLALSRSVARNRSILPPGGLPAATWLHLGGYYKQFLKRALHDWTRALLQMETTQAAEYAFAARQIQTLATTLNQDWNNTAIDPQALSELSARREKLHRRYMQLEVFRVAEREKAHIAGALKTPSAAYSRDIPVSEFDWADYHLSYLHNIRLSQFTPEYQSIIRGFVDSNIEFWGHGTGLVDLVNFYTGMSVLAMERLHDGLQSRDLKKTYNYAVLDGRLTKIIKENISRLWRKKDQDEYFAGYNRRSFELLPLWWLTKEHFLREHTAQTTRVPEQETITTTPAPVINQTELMQVDWERVRLVAETAEKLPTERFSAEAYTEMMLKTALDDTVNKMTDIAGRDILSPDQYIERWITDTLRAYGQAGNYSSASLFKVDYIRHPNAEIKTPDGFGGRNSPPRVFSLEQLVRGVHRQKDQQNKARSRIFWPDNFSSDLRDRLETGIGGDIDREIASLFDDNAQTLRDLYRVMTRRAALTYLARKNAVETSDLHHHAFANAVAMYLKGKIDAQLVWWHGSPVSGLIFIPVGKAVAGKLSESQAGVFLSVWNNDYYEVPWPGLVPTYRSKKKQNIKRRQKIVIESRKDFQEFMERFRTTRVGRRLARVDNAFDYEPLHAIASMRSQKVYTIGYNGPFTFTPLSAAALGDRLISLYREDIQDLYDTAILSDTELTRAIIHERLNALAIISGVLLMGASLALGGPAWVWVLASLGTMAFVEVVPHAMLYSQADSDEERDRYLQAMVMAVAFEVGRSIVSEVAGPLIKAAASRFSRMASTAFPTTLPQWYQFTRAKLTKALTKTGVRPLRKPAATAVPLSEATKHDLNELIKVFDPPSAGRDSDAFQPLPGSSGAQRGYGVGPGSTFLQQQGRLYDIMQQMQLLKFKTRYRVLTEWENPNGNYIHNSYIVFGERETDRVVIEVIGQGRDYSCIYMPEDEWLRNAIKKGEKSNVMVSYCDFDLPGDLAQKYVPLSQMNAFMDPVDYPQTGRHIFTPKAWQEKLSSMELTYTDMQRALDEMNLTDGDYVSEKIRETIEQNPLLQSELQKIPRLAPPLMKASSDEAINQAMRRSAHIYAVGPDIEKFHPLPKWMPLMDAPEEYLKKWKTSVTEYINKNKEFKLIKDNFILLKEAGGAGIVTVDTLLNIEREFIRVYGNAEKLAVLLAFAKKEPLIRDKILITLARFVNSTNPRILGEAYQRLEVIVERLYQIAWYHVIEQKLARVVPMTPFVRNKIHAFVIIQDPMARIMIILPQLMQHKEIAGLLMHEMSHLAVHSTDFNYMNSIVNGYPKLAEHHLNFGQYALAKNSPYSALGQSQQFIDLMKPKGFKELTEFDRALAQARVRTLPMLEAYVKMNNADSLVVLSNALLEQFDITPNTLGVREAINIDEWKASPAPSPSTSGRKKRAAQDGEDIFYHQFREDVLAAIFYQALSFTKADIYSVEKMAEQMSS